MFTTGFATKNNQSNTIFITGAGARSFELPQDCAFVTISACGGGGAGANGGSGTTAQVKWGGGGGSSGSISVAMWPRFFLPDMIYITIGAGGINGGAAASNTIVGSQAGSTTNSLLVMGQAGTAATAGTTANPGLGGTAVTKTGWNTNLYGYYYFGFGHTQYAGRQGNQGDLNSNSPTQTFYSPDQIYSIVSPGLGGATTNSSTSFTKYGNATYLIDFANTTAQPHGSSATGFGGVDGYTILPNNTVPLYFPPATGGISTRTAAGGAGGKAAPGCGGAGGGGGTTAGVGGNGGDGWVLINYW